MAVSDDNARCHSCSILTEVAATLKKTARLTGKSTEKAPRDIRKQQDKNAETGLKSVFDGSLSDKLPLSHTLPLMAIAGVG